MRHADVLSAWFLVPGCPLLISIGSACKEEAVPFHENRKLEPKGDEASPDSGDSAGSDSDRDPDDSDPDDSDPNVEPSMSTRDAGDGPPPTPPPSSGNPCGRFDEDAVHLWGVRGPDSLDRQGTLLEGIVNELNLARVCPFRMGVATPKIRPTDHRVLYRGTLYTGLVDNVSTSERRLFVYLPVDASGDSTAVEEVPTPGCDGVGISTFHIHPRTGDIYFNCDPDTECRSAIPLLQGYACFVGPWFKSDGSLAVEENLYAVGASDTYLVSGQGFLGFSLRTPESDEKTAVTYEGEAIPSDERDVLTRRSHENGFWVVAGGWGAPRRRFFIDENGAATLEGVYPLADGEGVMGWVTSSSVVKSWALDVDGNLYEDLGTRVVKSELDGEQTMVYDPPSEDRETSIYGGLSGYLMTGP